MMKLLFFTGMLAMIILSGCTGSAPYEDTGNNAAGDALGLLIVGAACEQDSDCVYALNAYPIEKCVSTNCPPSTEPQPETDDPAYEWQTVYLDECVNSAALQGKNFLGEDLQVDTRSNSCVCQPFASPDGFPTSLDGQKICRKTIEAPPEVTEQ